MPGPPNPEATAKWAPPDARMQRSTLVEKAGPIQPAPCKQVVLAATERTQARAARAPPVIPPARVVRVVSGKEWLERALAGLVPTAESDSPEVQGRGSGRSARPVTRLPHLQATDWRVPLAWVAAAVAVPSNVRPASPAPQEEAVGPAAAAVLGGAAVRVEAPASLS